jgi:hypothetical protein
MSKPAPTTNSMNSSLVDDEDKIDPITSLQEMIDDLSLSMFEALRKLRDAVAPESGSLGRTTQVPTTPHNDDIDSSNNNDNNNSNISSNDNNNNNNSASATRTRSATNNTNNNNDVDELWHHYRVGDDVEIMNHIQQACMALQLPAKKLTRREEFVRIHAYMNMQKDQNLVSSLASDILYHSSNIDHHVSNTIPGMHRTASQQRYHIAQLLQHHHHVSQELQSLYDTTVSLRTQCRQYVLDHTIEALDILD